MSLYDTLSVRKEATEKEIAQAYNKLMLKYDPEKYNGDKEYAKKRISDITDAFLILSDPIARKEYDRNNSMHTSQHIEKDDIYKSYYKRNYGSGQHEHNDRSFANQRYAEMQRFTNSLDDSDNPISDYYEKDITYDAGSDSNSDAIKSGTSALEIVLVIALVCLILFKLIGPYL